jgi:hypothetical protein
VQSVRSFRENNLTQGETGDSLIRTGFQSAKRLACAAAAKAFADRNVRQKYAQIRLSPVDPRLIRLMRRSHRDLSDPGLHLRLAEAAGKRH